MHRLFRSLRKLTEARILVARFPQLPVLLLLPAAAAAAAAAAAFFCGGFFSSPAQINTITGCTYF